MLCFFSDRNSSSGKTMSRPNIKSIAGSDNDLDKYIENRSLLSREVGIVTFLVLIIFLLFPVFILTGTIFLFLKVHEFNITFRDLSNLDNISLDCIDIIHWSS